MREFDEIIFTCIKAKFLDIALPTAQNFNEEASKKKPSKISKSELVWYNTKEIDKQYKNIIDWEWSCLDL